MIDGLKPTVPGAALLELLKKQIAFHKLRAEFYGNEYKRFSELKLDPTTTHYSSIRDPKEQFENKIKEHAQAATKLEFIATYLDVGENYRLNDSDLHALGVSHHRTFDAPPF